MHTIIKVPLIRNAELSVLKDYAVKQFLLVNNTRIIVLDATVTIDPLSHFYIVHIKYAM